MSKAQKIVQDLLELADVQIDGPRPFDIQVHDERFYKKVLGDRELGLGESYMEGWWSVEHLDQLVARLMSAKLRDKVRLSPKLIRHVVLSTIQNKQSVQRSRGNAAYHYEIGNDLYELMLDKWMMYTCGYYKDAKTLDEAQEAKMDLVCRKLQLKPGMSVLDIGCGWGGFEEYAARKYKVKVTGVTLVQDQAVPARKRTAGLPVEIIKNDYREVKGSYDRIVTMGFVEHVGPKNYHQLLKQCKGMLKDDGIMLHHMIGNNRSTVAVDPWIDKYIFPGGVIPSLAQISKAVENQLIIEDVQNFGPDYDKTLMAWHANFVRHYPELKDKYDERFYKMWEFYLLSCAGAFRARNMQLYQIVIRKIESSETYISPR